MAHQGAAIPRGGRIEIGASRSDGDASAQCCGRTACNIRQAMSAKISLVFPASSTKNPEFLLLRSCHRRGARQRSRPQTDGANLGGFQRNPFPLAPQFPFLLKKDQEALMKYPFCMVYFANNPIGKAQCHFIPVIDMGWRHSFPYGIIFYLVINKIDYSM